ncbi:Hypothetical predicted protein [Mytilus galloprovincialis]|uniref:OTU domain-containing protein n=1 Tax=Mytilus galloprovincialis TaxID=29158 RepID=A0A8B6CG20_MYTGA|nr:Hypothetical predicted protein [Mytilus galloprovincialis]
MITYVKGKTDVLSNFYPVLLNNNGITFKSAEHMYQSQKAIFHEEYELNAKIIIAHNAQNAKKLSKSIKTCVEWEQMKPIVQAEILKIKLQAVVGQPHRITRNVTKSEALLLQTYSIEVPTANETQIEHTADRVSSSILAKFHPAILSEFYPAETYGDGNCLYRAVSRAITGSESMYIVLRVLTLIEILSYPMFYDPNHTRFTDLIQDNRIVVATYLQLAKDVGMLGTYADMMHMFALSAVLKIPIRSYFPPQMNMEFVSEPYSRKVCGRNVNISEAPACTIMWTSAVIP